MDGYLQFKKSNCMHCYKCIRHCPIKAISFTTGQANILKDECVLCGNCHAVCPQNAKTVRNDVGKVRAFFEQGDEVYVSLAPSYIANFFGASIGSLRAGLQKLGFTDVEETAVGATTVKTAYDEMVRSGEHDIIISSCCHSLNSLIQKHYPKALPYLAPVLSPMLAHGKKLKEEHPGARVVFIGPCVSKKEEADLYPGYIDCVLTFEDLTDWFSEEKVRIPFNDKPELGGKARLFPTRGGILSTMDADNEEYSYLAVDGLENCITAIRDVIDGKIHKCFIEMSACKGSCVAGPTINKGRRFTLVGELDVIRNTGNEQFDAPYMSIDEIKKQIEAIPQTQYEVSKKDIEKVLRLTGKTLPEHELNCGSCGYDTCRKKAEAVLMGKAEVEMCLSYLMSKTQAFSDNIITHTPYGIVLMDEALIIKQINGTALSIFGLEEEHDAMGKPVSSIIDSELYKRALMGDDVAYEVPAFLEKSGKYVTQTIKHDKLNRSIISIIRDVTDIEETRQSRDAISKSTAEVADKVIEKQMRTVQKIASLLGETTAETLAALTKLKETISDD